MNYSRIRLTLRPRTLFEILDLTVVFLRRVLPSVWPLLSAAGVLWAIALVLVYRISSDPRGRLALLLPVLLFLRFWLQVFLVLACGRLAFVESVRFSELLEDLKEVGLWRVTGRGMIRGLKWASGFVVLVPLWIVLVRRFFDYEHWLLERLHGRELNRRLLHFRTESRVVAFRLLHLIFQVVSIFLGLQVMRILFEAATRMPGPDTGSPGAVLSLLLFYEPFFIVSRFLLYIQIRTDLEAWDVGLLFREGIRRTMEHRVWLLPFLFASIVWTFGSGNLSAAPEAVELVACTPAMKKMSWLKCDPPEYRSYSKEEIEKHIPAKREAAIPRKYGAGSAGEWMLYGGFLVGLGLLLYFLWHRFARILRSRGSAPVPQVVVREETPVTQPDVVAAAEAALSRKAFREALGFAYLLLLIRHPPEFQSYTPEELGRRLEGEPLYLNAILPFLNVYALVFYASHSADGEVVEPVVREMIRLFGKERGG